MQKIRVGVVGPGSIGVQHTRIYSEIDCCELTAVYDTNKKNAEKIVSKYGGRACNTLEEFAELIDAASVAVPTEFHYDVSAYLLHQKKHLLIEKPITNNNEQAIELSELAKKYNCILQVGHVERFNPAFEAIEDRLNNPRFLEITRLSPFVARNTEVGVVLDMMIHDIEILLHIIHHPIIQCDAVGIPVLTDHEDIANVRIAFKNGAVANITASRISQEKIRKIRIFQREMYISIDYQKQHGYIVQSHDGIIEKQAITILADEPLKKELISFISCIIENKRPRVSFLEAQRALELAMQITEQIKNRHHC